MMHRVDEKMGATAEDDELLLVFWRLAGGAVEALLFEEDIFYEKLKREVSKLKLANFAESGLKK